MTVHLIHVGYPKTGTTLLQEWFTEHPQIEHAPFGIAGHREAAGFAREAARPTEAIRARVTSCEELVMPGPAAGHHGMRDLTPRETAGDAERVCADLAALFPTAYALLVTRGFREMLFSSYSQLVRSAGTHVLGDEPPVRVELRGMWDYDGLVRTYEAAFGDRLLVLPYELLRDDPCAFVSLIEQPLGLDHHPPPDRVVNPSLSGAELRWYPRLSAVAKRAPLPARLKPRVLDGYARMTLANRLAPVVEVLQRAFPAPPVTLDDVPLSALEPLRGSARELCRRPHFAPYGRDYLEEPAESPSTQKAVVSSRDPQRGSISGPPK